MHRPGTRIVRLLEGLLVLGAVVALVACGGSGGGTGSGGSGGSGGGSRAALEGPTWVLVQVGSGISNPVPSTQVTAVFANGRVSGYSGCNRYDATYTVHGSSMRVSSRISTTKMMCTPEGQAIETQYLAALPKVTSFDATATKLVLTGGGAYLTYDGSGS